MGLFLSSLFGKKKAQILILGLDASGKTTIINRLKTGTNAVTIPTIGFNTETFEFGNLTFTAFDIGGQDNIRALWHHYYEGADAIVFVVDSADQARFRQVSTELQKLLCTPTLQHIPFLIFANKQDLSNAATTASIKNALKLHTIRNRKWKIAESVGTSGVGINEGFQWLSDVL